MASLISIFLYLIVFVISSIPLWLALKFMGGKGSIIKVVLVNVIVGIVMGVLLETFQRFGFLIAFIIVLYIYKEMFRLGWIRALLAWLLQGVVVIVLILILRLIGWVTFSFIF